ncbi:MAG: RNA polymerase sigma factor RpoH [Proteobacteria bacterium]|nr:RNA polymerase sigma factor RpoH [Pseudomonadota bacterium]
MSAARVPVAARDTGLAAYLAEVRKYPILGAEEEYMLAQRWRAHSDAEAARKLITSHLRLVAKIAMGYRGYGLPLEDVIAEGNVGLMKAVKRFEPERGFRLSTYAMWWIRASIQEYVLRSWSLVKVGTTAAQKKLFFNLRKIKGRIRALDEGDLPAEAVKEIAAQLDVDEDEVIDMNRRLSGPDRSLNAPLAADADADWIDRLEAPGPDQETALADAEEMEQRRELLQSALGGLNERERHIFTERCLADPPATLETLSQVYDISRERVRQIEVRAFEKVRKHMLNAAITAGMADREKLLAASGKRAARR